MVYLFLAPLAFLATWLFNAKLWGLGSATEPLQAFIKRSQYPGNGVSGLPWRVALVLVAPPVISLSILLAGVGIMWLDSGPIGTIVAGLLIGPYALGIGVMAAVLLSRGLLGASRPSWMLTQLAALVGTYLIWSRTALYYIESWNRFP